MNNKILISPYSAKLRNGQRNPKEFPHWTRLVDLLNQHGYEIIQIGIAGEDRIEGVSQFVQGWPFDKLTQLANDCATWLSVDNFWPHFAHSERLTPGIVFFGQSDPNLFGYRENTNLLRSRDYLRQFQYDTWEAATYRGDAFVYPENVIPHVYKLAPLPPKPVMVLPNVSTAAAQST